MLRGESEGRVPFALVAVLLLMSMGLSAVFAARIAHEEASRRRHDARLAALGDVADAVHREVVAQSQHLAVDAIRVGTEGLINETRIRHAFRGNLANYLSTHFPRTVRTVGISIADFEGDLRLSPRTLLDITPSNATEFVVSGGISVEVPDPRAPDGWAEVERMAYFRVHGFVNYSVTLDGIVLARRVHLDSAIPVPAPLMEARIEQLARTGSGDVAGVGRTVKAILATLVQFRVLDGLASPAKPGTTTADVLTSRDVELAVNLAVLLEEIRSFRAYDRTAAAAMDVAHGTSDRLLSNLLERYAASDTLDAVDLYALYTRLDEQGIHLGAVLAQAIAAIADDAVLKHLDYLGLTPLADFLTNFLEGSMNLVEGFLDWLTENPPKEAEYIRGYLAALFDAAGTPTTYLGPTTVMLPNREYDVPNGSSPIRISIPAHAFSIPFNSKDLLSPGLEELWIDYYPSFADGLRDVHHGIRDLANDVAGGVARDIILSGLLSETASGPVDPKDDESFFETVASRVVAAVDDAMERFREDMDAAGALMHNVLVATKHMIGRVRDHLIESYATIADESAELARGGAALIGDLKAIASEDLDFLTLTEAQKSALWGIIVDDASSSDWVSPPFSELRARDGARWRQALDVSDGAALPNALRERLAQAIVGAGGWLSLARDAVVHMMHEGVRGVAIASAGSIRRTNLGAFELWEPGMPDRRSAERFVVRHTPALLRHTANPLASGLWIEVLDPAHQVPRTADTPNVHYTRPFERSSRPFQTRWTVHVLGFMTVQAETERPVLLTPRGLEPLVLEEAWPLDFTIDVDAHSGWNLTGVAYQDSDDLLGDAWQFVLQFLDVAWDALSRLVSWVLDALRVVVRVLMEVLEPLLTFVHRVVEILTEVVRTLVDLLYQVAVGALQTILAAVDWAVDTLPATTISISAYGMRYHLVVNGEDGRELEIGVDGGPIEVGAAFVDLGEAQLPADVRYDVVGWWDVSLGPYRLEADIDPLRLFQDDILVGRAEWDHWWRLDLDGFILETYLDFSRSIPLGWIPVPPLGDVEIEIGFELILRRDPFPILFNLVETTIREAFSDVHGLDPSLGYVIRFAESLLRRFSENVVEVVERHGDDLVELSVYIEGEFDVGTGSPLGAGYRLSFVADGGALAGIVAWITANVAAYLRAMLNPMTPVEFQGFAINVLEHLFIRAEAHVSVEPPMPLRVALQQLNLNLELRTAAMIEANLALIGNLLGDDWGVWEVNFGVYVEMPTALGKVLGVPSGWQASLWFLRGSFHPY